MNDDKPSPSPAISDAVRPPPIPPNAGSQSVSATPTPWKKIILIVGLSILGALAFFVLVGALIFGGCMYLVSKAGH